MTINDVHWHAWWDFNNGVCWSPTPKNRCCHWRSFTIWVKDVTHSRLFECVNYKWKPKTQWSRERGMKSWTFHKIDLQKVFIFDFLHPKITCQCRGEEEVGPGIQLGVVTATSLKVEKFCYAYSNYIIVNYHPWNKHSPWKLVWKLLSFWKGLFSGAILVSGSVWCSDVIFTWCHLWDFFYGGFLNRKVCRICQNNL